MISLDLMKSLEVRIAGDRSNYLQWIAQEHRHERMSFLGRQGNGLAAQIQTFSGQVHFTAILCYDVKSSDGNYSNHF